MKGTIPDHLRSRFAELNALVAAAPPAPWEKVGVTHIGGLWHVGFAEGSELLLAISEAGRGLIDCASGMALARDDTPYDPEPGALVAEGIGPIAGNIVRIAGIYGGGLSRTTADGWSIEAHPLAWPDEELFLAPPGQDLMWTPSGQKTLLTKLPPPSSSLTAFGFSPTGRSLVIATRSDLTIFSREF